MFIVLSFYSYFIVSSMWNYTKNLTVFGRSFLSEMICLGRHLVCVSVCPNRELWPDRSTDEHPVWSKTCSIHPVHSNTSRKKNHPKIQPFSPYLGGEMGRGYGTSTLKGQRYLAVRRSFLCSKPNKTTWPDYPESCQIVIAAASDASLSWTPVDWLCITLAFSRIAKVYSGFLSSVWTLC
jgi:hypothetical protein